MAEPGKVVCRICKKNTAVEQNPSIKGAIGLAQDCPTCGHWWGLLDVIGPELGDPANAQLMPYLAAHIRHANVAGERRVELTSENWRRFAEQHSRTSIPRKLDLVMRWLERTSRFAGEYVSLPNDRVYPLFDAQNDDEMVFLFHTLLAQKLVEFEARSFTVVGGGPHSIKVRLTANGWSHLLPAESGGAPGTCFVAMSYDPALDHIFSDAILPALETDCGFLVNRVDRIPHNDQITNRIIAGIRGSQFVVADFTGQRQSVYYEAGFADAERKPVVRTCRDTDFESLHFDTRQYLHLKWSTPEGLREVLANHVKATIGTWGQRKGDLG